MRPRRSGLTLIECVVASVILAIAVLAITSVTLTGYRHLDHADTRQRAVRLAEDLLEEAMSRPHGTGGPGRASWGLDDYDGFREAPGDVRDFSGSLYAEQWQGFSRLVSVTPTSHAPTGLGGVVIPGRAVEVTIMTAAGEEWRLSRFAPEPVVR